MSKIGDSVSQQKQIKDGASRVIDSENNDGLVLDVGRDDIEIGWGAYGLIVRFQGGKYANQTYMWDGERLANNNIWVSNNQCIKKWSPERRQATDDEIEYVDLVVRQLSNHVEFSDG